MTYRMAPICVGCVHLLTATSCDAYPQEIPAAILANQADHRESYPGDRGIQFEPTGDLATRYAALTFDLEPKEATPHE